MANEGCKQTNASPGNPGVIKMKCLVWPSCPTYARSRVDQTYIFSPETIEYAPQSLKDKVLSIPNIDGVFLKPRPNFYLHNFLSFKKRVTASTPLDDDAKETIGNPKTKDANTNVVKLKDLEFLGLVRGLTANELVLEGASAISSSARASHQTWISDGSLYCSENFMPSDVFSEAASTDSASDFIQSIRLLKRQYCANWQYIAQNVSISVNASGVNQGRADDTFNYVHMPSVKGIAAIGDPIEAINSKNLSGYFSIGSTNVYRDINPGLHWRVLKRTPLFQGEDFNIELYKTAIQSTNINSKDAKFRMLEKFQFLDVNTIVDESESNCGSLDNQGFLDKDKNGKIIEETRKIFDFSRQVYFMIEIGVDDPEHHYLILIAENSFPLFCHIGKSPTLKCSVEEQTQSSTPQSSSDSPPPSPCASDSADTNPSESSDNNGNDSGRMTEVSVIEVPKKVYLRRLSTYEAASSATLLTKDKLKISVRQHAGNIVVTFSGYENSPWVISRKDIDPNSSPKPGVPITESQISYQPIRMVIPNKQIALMGGNIKCAFSFAPMLYETLQSYRMPQPFSIQGPVSADEIQFLWRDKAISQNPQVAVRQKSRQYTNEAGAYSEIALNENEKGTSKEDKVSAVVTTAMEVQPDFVKTYGKAPDLFSTNQFRPSYSFITVAAVPCTSKAGSTAETSVLMQASISFIPGDYLFPAIDGGDPWLLRGCVTPIVHFLRLYVPPKGKIFKKDPIDVSQHVLSYSDEWSETDWQKLEHQGSISFLISDGMKFRGNQANAISSLIDKAFYLQISLWWENGIMPTPVRELDKVVFTGLCLGGTIVTETNKRTLECKLFDYSKILRDQFFLNSPFFDRMRDVNAIQEILQIAGLRDGEDNDSTIEPGSMVRILTDSNPQDEWYSFFFNGEKIITREFALPGSYDILQAPFLRFNDGSCLWEGIDKISLLANKVAYFDRLGVFNFTALPYDQALFGGQQGTQTNWSINDWNKLSKFDFFASPKGMVSADISNQIIGDYKVERVVGDVVNEIKVISTSPNGEILIAGHVNYDSLKNPDIPGFLGYHKTFLQMDGIFGSEANVKWVVKNYTKMFIPPIRVCFKAIGRNKIKALDVITFQPLGSREKQPLIVSSVKSEVSASDNTWFQEFECLWLFPSQDIQWGASNEVGVGIDGTISG